ncbi:MAG: phosphopantothenoylcysteine decarboxylase, partial [Acidimicrobiales bacterium]|nr:phosphopantothenoylcysteine decarboxylase [Acidimicrobiales bacterium]
DDMDTINLETTHDFLIDLGARKNSKQILVGFAAETENLEENALGKLRKKKLDLIVANDVSLPEVGFAHDTNEVTIISENSKWTLPLSEKRVIADGILDAIIEIHQEQTEKDAS